MRFQLAATHQSAMAPDAAVELWYRGERIEVMPRLFGRNKELINFRHVIDSLIRKPVHSRTIAIRAICIQPLAFGWPMTRCLRTPLNFRR